jgi:biotin transport system substrate-specific component
MTQQQTLSISRPKAISDVLSIGVFALLTAVGAQIAIPTMPVPFTLQTLFVLLSGAVLGPRKGAAAQAVYLVSGAAGLPVFAGFSGSVLHLLGPTGGYLLAFPVAAFITGALVHRTPLLRGLPVFASSLIAMAAAMAVVFISGVAYLNLLVFHNWKMSLAAGFINLQVWDALKIVAAAGIYTAAGRRIAK